MLSFVLCTRDKEIPAGFASGAAHCSAPFMPSEFPKSYPLFHSNKYLAINGRGRTKVWKPESSGKP